MNKTDEKIIHFVNEQKEFLQYHLINWVPAFVQDVLKYSSVGLSEILTI